jgi:hypothetical protein
MRRALLALVVPLFVAACSGGPGGSTAAPSQDISALDPCAVVTPAEVEALVGPFLVPPVALNVPSSGSRECDYVGAQASVSVIFSPAVITPDLFASWKGAAIGAGGSAAPGVGDDAFYVLTPAAFNGGLLTVRVGTSTFTVGVQVLPNTQTQPMPDSEFRPTAVAIGTAVATGLPAA